MPTNELCWLVKLPHCPARLKGFPDVCRVGNSNSSYLVFMMVVNFSIKVLNPVNLEFKTFLFTFYDDGEFLFIRCWNQIT